MCIAVGIIIATSAALARRCPGRSAIQTDHWVKLGVTLAGPNSMRHLRTKQGRPASGAKFDRTPSVRSK